jgi:hypothetical protein
MRNLLVSVIRGAPSRPLFLASLLLIAILGCMPIFVTYWEPAAQTGRLSNSVRGAVGYKDRIEFSFNDVTVQFIGGGSWLSIDLLISEGKSAAFLSDKLELCENDSSVRLLEFSMTDWDLTTLRQIHISPTAVMVGKNTNVAILGGSKAKVYSGSVEFGGEDRVRYYIKPPSLKINGQVFDIPRIEFIRKEGAGVGPIN